MKKLIALALLATCLSAQADTLEQPNQAGGKIVLTDRPCDKPGMDLLREAYTYEANGAVGIGCWTVLDGKIHIAWRGGERSVFPMEAFSLVGRAPAPPAQPMIRALPS